MGCYFRWGDGTTAESGNFTLCPGIDPSLAQLQYKYLDSVSFLREGTLSFSDGATFLSFPDCRALEVNYSNTATSRSRVLRVRDRRWKWRLTGSITGEYNRRDENGDIIDETNKKSAQALAALCLIEMGESGYSVSGLPSSSYPYVDWREDNPAEALDDLCNRYSAQICLKTNNKVSIYAKGVGLTPPELDKEEYGLHVTVIDKPEYGHFVGGRNLYQMDVSLTAVGEDTDGTIQTLSNLSYKPTDDNWASVLSDTTLTTDERKAINKSIFRYYRLPDNVTIGGTSYTRAEAKRRWHPELVEKATQDSEAKRLTAYVTGSHRTSSNQSNYLSVESNSTDKVQVAFSFDERLGVIVFNQPVYEITASKMVAASLTLTCCFEGDEYTRDVAQPGGITGYKETFRRDDVFYEYIDDAVQNQTAVDAKADDCISDEMEKYKTFTYAGTQRSETATYAGIHDIDPDGAIQQVTWNIASKGSPPTTRVSWGTHHDSQVGSLRIRVKERETIKQIRKNRDKRWENNREVKLPAQVKANIPAPDPPDLAVSMPPIKILNTSGSTIPARSFAAITYMNDKVFIVGQVDSHVIEPGRLVVTGASEIADGRTGQAFDCSAGSVWVKYNSTGPTRGRYFGPVKDQWYGQLNYYGFVVKEVSGDYALVAIEANQGVWETTAAGGSGTVTIKRCWSNGTLVTPELTVGYLTDETAPASGVKGRLLSVVGSPNGIVFVPFGGSSSGTHSSPATVGTTAETEAAQTDTWDKSSQGANDGVNKVVQYRTAYSHTGDKKLYAYYRTEKYDSDGNLYEISAETRVEIDAPVAS